MDLQKLKKSFLIGLGGVVATYSAQFLTQIDFSSLQVNGVSLSPAMTGVLIVVVNAIKLYAQKGTK